ncbi:hypothetical protein BH18ACT15_BH18ACT15_12580 [soil metagenome]
MRDFLTESLASYLDLLASKEPAPGGGAAAATAVAMAAALAAMSGRFSDTELGDSSELVARAGGLIARSAPLAQADAEAYGRVLSAYRRPAGEDGQGREQSIRAALSAAADVPLEIAEIAADVAALAADVAQAGNPNLRGDAVAAALLAEAGGRSASMLVGINLRGRDDPRVPRAKKLSDNAAQSARCAVAAVT